jgi:large subunit ribosomal protein L35
LNEKEGLHYLFVYEEYDPEEDEMPKLKTHRGAAKRFKITATGKVKRSKAFKSHLMTGKPAKRTRGLRTAVLVADTDQRNIKTLLPYL